MTTTAARRTLLLTACVAVSLGGCSWLGDWATPEKEIKPPQPQMQVKQTSDATWLEPVPGSEPVTHLVPGADEQNRDAMRRLEKLERSMTEMRSDMNTMMPALNKLAGLQADLHNMLAAQNAQAVQSMQATPEASVQAIQPEAGGPIAGLLPEAVVGRMEGSDQDVMEEMPVEQNRQPSAPAGAPPVRPLQAAAAPIPLATTASAPIPVSMPVSQPVTQPAMAAPVTSPVPQQGTAEAVSQIRVGDHPDKTRIVFDTSDNVAFGYDLDNNEHVLMVSLQGTGWSGPAQAAVASSMVESYQALPDGQGGTYLAIQLKNAAQVLWAQALPAAGDKNARIVIDLGPI